MIAFEFDLTAIVDDRALNEHVVMTVRGAYSPAPPAECRAKDTQFCITYPVAGAITQLRPL